MSLRTFLVLAFLVAAVHSAQAQPVQELSRTLDSKFLPIPSINAEAIRYGDEHWHVMQFINKSRAANSPLVVRVGGADFDSATPVSIAFLPSFFYDSGFAYASLQSRPAGKGTAAERAEDIAAAIGELVRNATKHRIDPSRIVLVGQGSGAHFAALVATDERYVEGKGVSFSALRAVVSINGEGFDIPGRIASSSEYQARKYRKVFGDNAARQVHLSPTRHLRPPNVSSFLFLVSENEAKTAAQAAEFASLLREVGVAVAIQQIPATKSNVASTYIGAAQNAGTEELLTFVRAAVAVQDGGL